MNSLMSTVAGWFRVAWHAMLQFREQEEAHWRAQAGEEPPEPEASGTACATTLQARPLSELVEERAQEVRPLPELESGMVPSLSELVAQRNREHEHAPAGGSNGRS